MSDYTPTTEEVRCMYMLCASYPAKALPDRNLIPSKIALKQFDRWLAAHDREIAEKAWDEGFMRANRLVNCRMCRGTTVPKINPYTV